MGYIIGWCIFGEAYIWGGHINKILRYVKNGDRFNAYLHFHEATNLASEVTGKRKQEYHNNLFLKLNNPETSAKTYWSNLITFNNGKKNPVIPPLLINSKLISNLRKKANYFVIFIPIAPHFTTTVRYLKLKTFITGNKLSSLQFEDNDIIKIIRSLDICKAHGHDDILVRMLKLCELAVAKSLSVIFRNCVNQCTFPYVWKKSNICPIH